MFARRSTIYPPTDISFYLRPDSLDAPLHRLDILPRHLVIQHMGNVILPNLLARRTLMDTDRCHTDWPSGVADGETEIGIVGPLVGAGLHVVDDLGEIADHVGGHVLRASAVPRDDYGQPRWSTNQRQDFSKRQRRLSGRGGKREWRRPYEKQSRNSNSLVSEAIGREASGSALMTPAWRLRAFPVMTA